MDKIPQLDKPDLYVVARILERLWREETPMLKTRLQVSSNLNYDVFRKDLAWMVDHELTSLEDSADGHEKVRLSPKGEEAYRKLVQWINEVVRERGPGM